MSKKIQKKSTIHTNSRSISFGAFLAKHVRLHGNKYHHYCVKVHYIHLHQHIIQKHMVSQNIVNSQPPLSIIETATSWHHAGQLFAVQRLELSLLVPGVSVLGQLDDLVHGEPWIKQELEDSLGVVGGNVVKLSKVFFLLFLYVSLCNFFFCFFSYVEKP